MTSRAVPAWVPKLERWMGERAVNQSDLARLLGVERGLVSMVLSGVRPPSKNFAAKLELATDRAITASELLVPQVSIPARPTPPPKEIPPPDPAERAMLCAEIDAWLAMEFRSAARWLGRDVREELEAAVSDRLATLRSLELQLVHPNTGERWTKPGGERFPLLPSPKKSGP